MLDTKSMSPLWRWAVRIGVVLLWAALMAAAIRYRWHQSPAYEKEIKREEAHAYFKERCKNSGVFIYKKLSGIDTIYLMNTRPYGQTGLAGGQYSAVDPYGYDNDSFEKYGPALYAWTFIGGADPRSLESRVFKLVELQDSRDGKLYRFTGKWVAEPHGAGTQLIFHDTQEEIRKVTATYGIQFKDISTAEDRFHWVAGSSLSVIDLATKEVVATRIGYLWDSGMGSTAAGRRPWLEAEGQACPRFESRPRNKPTARNGQSARFAAQVLNPGASL